MKSSLEDRWQSIFSSRVVSGSPIFQEDSRYARMREEEASVAAPDCVRGEDALCVEKDTQGSPSTDGDYLSSGTIKPAGRREFSVCLIQSHLVGQEITFPFGRVIVAGRRQFAKFLIFVRNLKSTILLKSDPALL